MTNFINKMTLIQFQIRSASKIMYLQVCCKDFCHYRYIFWHRAARGKYDYIEESGKLAKDSLVSFSLFFFHQNILSSSFLFCKFQISLTGFSNVTGFSRYLHTIFLPMSIANKFLPDPYICLHMHILTYANNKTVPNLT